MQFQKLQLAVFPSFAQCVWVIVSPTWTFFLTWSLFHNYYTIRQDVWEGWWWRGWKGGMKEDTSFLPLNNIYPIPFFSLHTAISHILFYPIEFKFVWNSFKLPTAVMWHDTLVFWVIIMKHQVRIESEWKEWAWEIKTKQKMWQCPQLKEFDKL